MGHADDRDNTKWRLCTTNPYMYYISPFRDGGREEWMEGDRQTDRKGVREAGRQINKQAGIQTNIQANRHAGIHIC